MIEMILITAFSLSPNDSVVFHYNHKELSNCYESQHVYGNEYFCVFFTNNLNDTINLQVNETIINGFLQTDEATGLATDYPFFFKRVNSAKIEITASMNGKLKGVIDFIYNSSYRYIYIGRVNNIWNITYSNCPFKFE